MIFQRRILVIYYFFLNITHNIIDTNNSAIHIKNQLSLGFSGKSINAKMTDGIGQIKKVIATIFQNKSAPSLTILSGEIGLVFML